MDDVERPNWTVTNALAFHFLPTRYVHPSWWSSDWMPENLFERLGRNPRCHTHLSRFFLKQTGLDSAPQFDVSPPAETLSLTPGRELHRLVYLAGITLLSPAIAGVLRGAERRSIKNAIGARHYEFALKRGRFLLQQGRMRHVVPTGHLTDASTLAADCRALGLRALASAFEKTPTDVIRRVQFKFSKVLVDRHWRPLEAEPSSALQLFLLLDRQVDVT